MALTNSSTHKITDYGNPILEYWEEIESGKVEVCKKVRRVYEKLVADLKAEETLPWRYDAQKANKVLAFIETYCKQSKGKSGGKALKLQLWQRAFLAAVFGFVNKETGFRKYREACLIVARKNGKSTLGSGVGNYLLFADKEKGPEIVSVATKKDQAKIVWKEARNMIRKSPALSKRAKCRVADIVTSFNDGSFAPLSSDSNTLDGLNIHGAFIDELHAIADKNLYDVIVDGMSAREQPLCIIISTAGTVREGIFDLKYSEAQDIINGYDDGLYVDEGVLFVIYELDSRDEWQDPKCWIKANPGLGVIKQTEQLAVKVKKAQHDATLVKNLLCKDFNIRETSSAAWLSFEAINNETKLDYSALAPRYFIGGADLSSTTDLTCATAIFKKSPTSPIYVEQMYWLPEALLEQRAAEDKIRYDVWVEQGLMRVSQGNRVHYSDVTQWFVEISQKYNMNLLWCGYDSWSSSYWVEEMVSYFGKEALEPVIQGKKTLSSPMKNMGADLAAKNIIYNNNPLLKWCLTNTAVDIDKNGNIQPMKANQLRRIDGTASLLNAYVTYERHLNEYHDLNL